MKGSTVFAISAAAGLILWAVYKKINAANALNFYVASVALSFQGVVPVLRFDLGIQNASSTPFNINAVVGNLYANDMLIGNVSSFVPLVIHPTSSVVYPLYVRLSLIGIVTDLVKLFSGGSGLSQTLKFDGHVNESSNSIPLQLAYKIV